MRSLHLCVVCAKTLTSHNNLRTHNRTKMHRNNVQRLAQNKQPSSGTKQDIIRVLNRYGDMTARQISQILDRPVNTIWRVLREMKEVNMVTPVSVLEKPKRYKLGVDVI